MLVLSPAKRVRAVNPAFETLTGIPAGDAIGHACLRKGPTDDIFRTLAPPGEAKASVTTVRRAEPGSSAGPPWWDVTFVPLPQAEGPPGYLVLIDAVAAAPKVSMKIIPAMVAAVRKSHQLAIGIEGWAGSTPLSRQFVAKLHQAAASSAPVWLTGEAGVGKETAARAIHGASPKKEQAFFGLDAAAVPGFLAESILFGRGSFGESGLLGTLFLKEPQHLPADVREQLTAWLDGPGRAVRVIVGTRRTVGELVDSGEIPVEFVARLAVIEITVPPLRERRSEWPMLIDRIARRIGRSIPNETRGIASHARWPGNFRELLDTLAGIDGEGPIRPEQLPRTLREAASLEAQPLPKNDPGPKLDDVLIQVERRMLMVALKESQGNATKAADWLGIARARFLRRAEALGVTTRGLAGE
jgi:DNA-binding NtrC family response regulator